MMDRGEAYRFYVTDMLRGMLGQGGVPRFYDLVKNEDVEEQDPQEIIDRIKHGLENL